MVSAVREFESRSHAVYSAKWHLIWTPKYRRAVLDGGVDVHLKEIIGQVCGAPLDVVRRYVENQKRIA